MNKIITNLIAALLIGDFKFVVTISNLGAKEVLHRIRPQIIFDQLKIS